MGIKIEEGNPPFFKPSQSNQLRNSTTMSLSSATLQQERSKTNRIPHEQLAYTFTEGDTASFGCGDVGILHNIAILLKSKDFDEKFQKAVNRFHITVRTMRRSPHWDWVKSDHIALILGILDEIYESLDDFVLMFKEGQQFFMDEMEKSVESGSLSEGDYLQLANGMKAPYEFITGSEFKKWVKGRSDFYKTLDGKTPNVKVIQLSRMNENDGKALLITA